MEPDPQIDEVVSEIGRLTAPFRAFAESVPNLVEGAAVIGLGVLVALAVRWALRQALLRTFRNPEGFVREALARTRRLGLFAFILLGVVVTLPASNLPPGWRELLQHAVGILLIVLVGWTLSVIVSRIAERHLRRYVDAEEDNFQARKYVTQIRVLRRTTNILIFVITAASCLLTFESVQEYGAGLFASAGVAGIVAAVAARPVLANLFAGIQIAITQPIRINDAVIVEGEWGWIEEITATYVVVKIWDWRRLVLPISYFIEKPFQNWTKASSSINGSVILSVDYQAPFEEMRAKFDQFVRASKLWDGQVSGMQVIDATDHTVQIRALMSARSSPRAWDLRCEVREKFLLWLQQAHPEALPRTRGDLRMGEARNRPQEMAAGE